MLKKLYVNALLIMLVSNFSCVHNDNSNKIELSNWKFKVGDSLQWAKPGFDDSGWDLIGVDYKWDKYGYDDIKGFAWYRTTVYIPSSLKKTAKYDKMLAFDIGMIDNADQVFLNGQVIGSNGETISITDSNNIKFKKGKYWDKKRKYFLPIEDDRILWDEENVIAVKVWVKRGPGGIYNASPVVRMKNLSDIIDIDYSSTTYKISNRNKFNKEIFITNSSDNYYFSCNLNIIIKDKISGEKVEEIKKQIKLAPNKQERVLFEFKTHSGQNCIAEYSFTDNRTGDGFVKKEEIPYLLTPPETNMPKINGPVVYGAMPGNKFLYKIPVSGSKPIKYNVENLPSSLHVNSETGIISGITPSAGSYRVIFTAENSFGKAKKEFTIISGDRLALTPPMGWNSWNCWGLSVSDKKIRKSADAMVKSGLSDFGFTYINIDDGWEASERLPDGTLMGNEKFPDMFALSEYVHSLGLKLGIYSSPGPLTCGGYLGSYKYEFIDAKKWAEWGIDYLKYDWCYYEKIAKDHSLPELKKPYVLMRRALDKTNRDIVYSICQYGWGDVWEWGYKDGGNLWRTTFDIIDSWESLEDIGFSQYKLSPFAKPGGWNDPDMLIVGWVGWGSNLHPTRLTPDEQYTHLTLWTLLSAPLILGNDLERFDDFTLNLLTNSEVLDINQDPLGKQAEKLYDKNRIQYWVKELSDGNFALGIFNLNKINKTLNIDLKNISLKGKYHIRDLWRQKDIGSYKSVINITIPWHGVVLFKLIKENN